MTHRFVKGYERLRLWLPTMHARLTIGMTLLLVVFTSILAFSFQVTTQIRADNPVSIVLDNTELERYAILATEANLSHIRGAVFQNLLLLTVLGTVGTYFIAGRMLRPLRQTTAIIKRVNAESLNTRLPTNLPDDEIRILTETFNQMLDRLEQTFVQQGHFVADAAHELRTPLATLRLTVDTMPELADLSPESYVAIQDTFQRTLDRLEKLVASLLLLAAGEQALPETAVSLIPLTEATLDVLKPLAKTHLVSLAYEATEDLFVAAEPSLFNLILTNLVENGIRYNKPGGQVTVRIVAENDQAIISVQDTGVGIPAAEQVRIFDRFYRLGPSRTRHQGGAGLGLSLVQHLVHNYNGSITVESKSGHGSTFTISLPLAQTE